MGDGGGDGGAAYELRLASIGGMRRYEVRVMQLAFSGLVALIESEASISSNLCQYLFKLDLAVDTILRGSLGLRGCKWNENRD